MDWPCAIIRLVTTIEASPARIFADARRMHDAALERMAVGDIRDAAEKAWCATRAGNRRRWSWRARVGNRAIYV